MNAARAIREAREQAGLPQAALAARAGTSQATLSAYENGRKEPTVATLARLLEAAGAQLRVDTALERRARTFSRVLDLAAALPTRHEPTLRYPRLP